MIEDWLQNCHSLARAPGDFYAGTRKIFRNHSISFDDLDSDLVASDAGYKKLKMSLLRKLYIHTESIESAVDQWSDRAAKGKYGSVGFTCYNHILKPHSSETANKRTSTMGPCLQSVILTVMPGRICEVDVFYRTTELFKKFPADLVLLRDDMLSRFNFSECPFTVMNCHFANVSVNPAFVSVPLTLVDDPLYWLEKVKVGDPKFYGQCLKWLDMLLGDEYIKFKQTRNTSEALKRSMPEKTQKKLKKYVKKERAKQ